MSSVTDGASNTAAYSEFVIEKWSGNIGWTLADPNGVTKQMLRSQVYNWSGGTLTEEVRNNCLNQAALNDVNGERVMRGVLWSWPFVGVGGALRRSAGTR